MIKSKLNQNKTEKTVVVVFNGSVRLFVVSRNQNIKETKDKDLLAEARLLLDEIKKSIREKCKNNHEHIFYTDS